MNDDLCNAYKTSQSPSLQLGGILLNGKLLPDSGVNLVLKSFNRHGLIAGATGSGKTKTMQVLSEQLSLAGVPSLVMDIKGDVSGLAMPGEANDALLARSKSLNLSFNPRGFPIEMLTLNEAAPGVPMRATVSDFGAVLFSRMLDINETQSGVMTIIFEYAKESKIPLINLNDVKTLLQYVQSDEGKAEIESRFGSTSSSSIGAIMRRIIELEAQGGDNFFAQPAFNVMDLVRTNSQGQGIISILRLMDMQDNPKLFSTFMLKLLADVYRLFPELGDPPKPKLVLFIDEAHLIFNNASKALLNLLNTMVKLIRSKGVGLIFCTQTPNDIPDAVLSQLGLKVQHALRAFTAKDRQAMKLVAQNFPLSTFYNTEQLLTSLGIGEGLLSALDENGQPTPLIQCLVRAPESRMGIITPTEMNNILSQSMLMTKYGQRQDTPSAASVLEQRKETTPEAEESATQNAAPKAIAGLTILTALSKNTLVRQITRDLFRKVLNIVISMSKKK